MVFKGLLFIVSEHILCTCCVPVSVRFNTGPNVNAGGLEMHRDGKWYGICDSGFDKTAALVACKSVRKDFIDATIIPGDHYFI